VTHCVEWGSLHFRRKGDLGSNPAAKHSVANCCRLMANRKEAIPFVAKLPLFLLYILKLHVLFYVNYCCQQPGGRSHLSASATALFNTSVLIAHHIPAASSIGYTSLQPSTQSPASSAVSDDLLSPSSSSSAFSEDGCWSSAGSQYHPDISASYRRSPARSEDLSLSETESIVSLTSECRSPLFTDNDDGGISGGHHRGLVGDYDADRPGSLPRRPNRRRLPPVTENFVAELKPRGSISRGLIAVDSGKNYWDNPNPTDNRQSYSALSTTTRPSTVYNNENCPELRKQSSLESCTTGHRRGMKVLPNARRKPMVPEDTQTADRREGALLELNPCSRDESSPSLVKRSAEGVDRCPGDIVSVSASKLLPERRRKEVTLYVSRVKSCVQSVEETTETIQKVVVGGASRSDKTDEDRVSSMDLQSTTSLTSEHILNERGDHAAVVIGHRGKLSRTWKTEPDLSFKTWSSENKDFWQSLQSEVRRPEVGYLATSQLEISRGGSVSYKICDDDSRLSVKLKYSGRSHSAAELSQSKHSSNLLGEKAPSQVEHKTRSLSSHSVDASAFLDKNQPAKDQPKIGGGRNPFDRKYLSGYEIQESCTNIAADLNAKPILQQSEENHQNNADCKVAEEINYREPEIYRSNLDGGYSDGYEMSASHYNIADLNMSSNHQRSESQDCADRIISRRHSLCRPEHDVACLDSKHSDDEGVVKDIFTSDGSFSTQKKLAAIRDRESGLTGDRSCDRLFTSAPDSLSFLDLYVRDAYRHTCQRKLPLNPVSSKTGRTISPPKAEKKLVEILPPTLQTPQTSNTSAVSQHTAKAGQPSSISRTRCVRRAASEPSRLSRIDASCVETTRRIIEHRVASADDVHLIRDTSKPTASMVEDIAYLDKKPETSELVVTTSVAATELRGDDVHPDVSDFTVLVVNKDTANLGETQGTFKPVVTTFNDDTQYVKVANDAQIIILEIHESSASVIEDRPIAYSDITSNTSEPVMTRSDDSAHPVATLEARNESIVSDMNESRHRMQSLSFSTVAATRTSESTESVVKDAAESGITSPEVSEPAVTKLNDATKFVTVANDLSTIVPEITDSTASMNKNSAHLNKTLPEVSEPVMMKLSDATQPIPALKTRREFTVTGVSDSQQKKSKSLGSFSTMTVTKFGAADNVYLDLSDSKVTMMKADEHSVKTVFDFCEVAVTSPSGLHVGMTADSYRMMKLNGDTLQSMFEPAAILPNDDAVLLTTTPVEDNTANVTFLLQKTLDTYEATLNKKLAQSDTALCGVTASLAEDSKTNVKVSSEKTLDISGTTEATLNAQNDDVPSGRTVSASEVKSTETTDARKTLIRDQVSRDVGLRATPVEDDVTSVTALSEKTLDSLETTEPTLNTGNYSTYSRRTLLTSDTSSTYSDDTEGARNTADQFSIITNVTALLEKTSMDTSKTSETILNDLSLSELTALTSDDETVSLRTTETALNTVTAGKIPLTLDTRTTDLSDTERTRKTTNQVGSAAADVNTLLGKAAVSISEVTLNDAALSGKTVSTLDARITEVKHATDTVRPCRGKSIGLETAPAEDGTTDITGERLDTTKGLSSDAASCRLTALTSDDEVVLLRTALAEDDMTNVIAPSEKRFDTSEAVLNTAAESRLPVSTLDARTTENTDATTTLIRDQVGKDIGLNTELAEDGTISIIEKTMYSPETTEVTLNALTAEKTPLTLDTRTTGLSDAERTRKITNDTAVVIAVSEKTVAYTSEVTLNDSALSGGKIASTPDARTTRTSLIVDQNTKDESEIRGLRTEPTNDVTTNVAQKTLMNFFETVFEDVVPCGKTILTSDDEAVLLRTASAEAEAENVTTLLEKTLDTSEVVLNTAFESGVIVSISDTKATETTDARETSIGNQVRPSRCKSVRLRTKPAAANITALSERHREHSQSCQGQGQSQGQSLVPGPVIASDDDVVHEPVRSVDQPKYRRLVGGDTFHVSSRQSLDLLTAGMLEKRDIVCERPVTTDKYATDHVKTDQRSTDSEVN